MPTIINMGLRLIRISKLNPQSLEMSDNAEISWHLRFSGTEEVGEFLEIFRRGETIFATTTTGRFRSVDSGSYWMKI